MDSLSHDFYLKAFVDKSKGRIVWEWANCSISIFWELGWRIEYKATGAKERLEEEKEQQANEKKQDI